MRNPKDYKAKIVKVNSHKEQLEIFESRTPFKLSRVFLSCLRSQKERKLMNKGLNRINKELEVDRFLRGQIKLRIAINALFSRAERYLIRNNRNFIITSDEDQTLDSQQDERRKRY